MKPNISDIRFPAFAAQDGAADEVSLLNTISSIMSVDLDAMSPEPSIEGKGTHGGYCGPAVKPIALNMTSEIVRDSETLDLPISAIGGISNWKLDEQEKEYQVVRHQIPRRETDRSPREFFHDLLVLRLVLHWFLAFPSLTNLHEGK